MRADRLLVTAQLGRNRTRAVKQAGDARHLSLQRGGGLRDKAAEPLVIARRVQVLQRRPLQRDPGRHPLVEHRRGAARLIAARHLELRDHVGAIRSEEHTSELQSLMRISYAVFCLKTKKNKKTLTPTHKP